MDSDLIAQAIRLLRAAETQGDGPTVAEVWAKYAEWGPRNLRNWKTGQGVHWKHLRPFFGDRRVAQVGLADVDAYRARRTTVEPATRNREMSSLRACLFWALKRNLIARNPLTGMEQEKEGPGRTEFIDEVGLHRLLAKAPHPIARIVFLFAFDGGMRRGEILGLHWGSVDLDASLVRLGDGDVKSGSGRIVPLTERACDALRELPKWSAFVFSVDGGPVPKSTLNDWFRAARDRAGLPKKLTFHCLRHSCATLMRRRGVAWPLVKAALGWKTDVAARRYQQYSAEDWRSLREKMNSGIVEEIRKGPLRAIPVSENVQATSEK